MRDASKRIVTVDGRPLGIVDTDMQDVVILRAGRDLVMVGCFYMQVRDALEGIVMRRGQPDIHRVCADGDIFHGDRVFEGEGTLARGGQVRRQARAAASETAKRMRIDLLYWLGG